MNPAVLRRQMVAATNAQRLCWAGHIAAWWTGFTGVAIGRTEYIGGNERAYLQSRALHDGLPDKPSWFEAPLLIELQSPPQQAKVPAVQIKATTADWPPEGTRPLTRS